MNKVDMNTIDTQKLLNTIRTMHAELAQTSPASVQPTENGFGTLLKDAVGQVNDAQMGASALKKEFESGASDTSLAEVMIASQKASLGFRAMTEVRNKLITAYQDIMNMPV